jgi:hypothetical protein
MIKTFAIIDNNVVNNLIYLDDESELVEQLGAVSVPDNVRVAIGTVYENDVFIEIPEDDDSIDASLPDLSFAEIEELIKKIIDEETSKP